MPEDVVRAQHQAMAYSHQQLAAEGFNTIVFADNLHRLEPFLKRLSQAREADLGRDGSKSAGCLPPFFVSMPVSAATCNGRSFGAARFPGPASPPERARFDTASPR
ncbi:hypothetical protein [Streptomyces afghaniensis]|uniref:hypothetical protein n=1 Tax=Streptomyces afghaniensis TaxID=66865 RepID=UPI003F4BB3CE